MTSNMEWITWIMLWIIFCIRYSKLVIDNPSIRIYVNKTENSITFKIKRRYYLELLILETIKLFGSTKSKKNNDKIGKNVPQLEFTEVILILCNIVNSDY